MKNKRKMRSIWTGELVTSGELYFSHKWLVGMKEKGFLPHLTPLLDSYEKKTLHSHLTRCWVPPDKPSSFFPPVQTENIIPGKPFLILSKNEDRLFFKILTADGIVCWISMIHARHLVQKDL